MGAGGPTGVAMNPARDMGPRLAHWVLPIRGKGSSEFLSYSCVPPQPRCRPQPLLPAPVMLACCRQRVFMRP